jgi:dTDP-4-amino-4,6-dideoxygalactose transaminase
MNVPFGDLRREYASIKGEVDAAIHRVLDKGWFVLGEEVRAFESEFAEFTGARFAVGVGSGTEALHLALIAAGVKSGDEVITAANTCVPTLAAITFAGAVPVLVDADPVSYNLDPANLERVITPRTRAIVPVHLYGQSADMDPILETAGKHGIAVIEDAAQAHGTTYKGRSAGTLGRAGCFSFYPSKNLGAYGDAGAVVTDDEAIDRRLRQLRNYGEEVRYHHRSKGFNSRLDEIQAAVLRAKLPHLKKWNRERTGIASIYDSEIDHPLVRKPGQMGYGQGNHHLYPIMCERRDDLQAHLKSSGVATLIHYPVPIHLQDAYRDLGFDKGDFPAAEKCGAEELSLPIFQGISAEEAMYVASCVNAFV